MRNEEREMRRYADYADYADYAEFMHLCKYRPEFDKSTRMKKKSWRNNFSFYFN